MGIEILINPFNTVVCIHTHTDIHTAQAHAHTRTPTLPVAAGQSPRALHWQLTWVQSSSTGP